MMVSRSSPPLAAPPTNRQLRHPLRDKFSWQLTRRDEFSFASVVGEQIQLTEMVTSVRIGFQDGDAVERPKLIDLARRLDAGPSAMSRGIRYNRGRNVGPSSGTSGNSHDALSRPIVETSWVGGEIIGAGFE